MSADTMDRIYVHAQTLTSAASVLAEGNTVAAAFALNLAAEAARCNALRNMPESERAEFLAGLQVLIRAGVASTADVVAKSDAEIASAVSAATGGVL